LGRPSARFAWVEGGYVLLRIHTRNETSQFGGHFYVSRTNNLRARLAKHNAGEVPHTAKFRPRRIRTAVAFNTESSAISFEGYLKSGSARAFAKKRLQTSSSHRVEGHNRSPGPARPAESIFELKGHGKSGAFGCLVVVLFDLPVNFLCRSPVRAGGL
jgi:putative endonuclease